MEKIGTIRVEGVKIYAFHGVHPLENKIGQWYTVDLSIDVNTKIAMEEDDLNGTIDYEKLVKIIHHQMKIPSKLLEHVADRIVNDVKLYFPQYLNGVITVTKHYPPIVNNIQKMQFSYSF